MKKENEKLKKQKKAFWVVRIVALFGFGARIIVCVVLRILDFVFF